MAAGADQNNEINTLMKDAAAQFAARQYDAAIACYTRALTLDPGNALAYYNRGCVYTKKEDFVKAIADWNTVLEIEPNHAKARRNIPAAYVKRGEAYAKSGDAEHARTEFEKALKLDPDNEEATNNLKRLSPPAGGGQAGTANAAPASEEFEALIKSGTAHYKAKDYDRAIDDFTGAIRLRSGNPAGYYNRGIAYYSKDDKAHAVADFEAAVKIAPDNDKYRQTLDKARGALAAAQPPTPPAAPAPAAEETQREKAARLEAAADAAANVARKEILSLTQSAQAHFEAEEWDAAIADYEKAMERGADAGLGEDFFSTSRQLIERAQTEATQPRRAVLAASIQTHFAHGYYDTVRRELQELLALTRDEDERKEIERLRSGMAYALAQQGIKHGKERNFDQGVAELEVAVRIMPDNDDFWNILETLKAGAISEANRIAAQEMADKLKWQIAEQKSRWD